MRRHAGAPRPAGRPASEHPEAATSDPVPPRAARLPPLLRRAPRSRRQRGAPDAAAAAARIEAEHRGLLELCALIALGGAGSAGPSPFSRVLLSPLDGAAPADGAGPVVDDSHWHWAVSQLRLGGDQVGTCARSVLVAAAAPAR